ncbi:GNAT family N-acetyltransferase [Fusibacter ferrireducens]|uniref:GNAT family N-acetyltransferase n=1 Tax=Fusibacter ferrireducens TaxID=2785058 RepID=A0ABR9ZQM9_9FIRM|nr:GNAT family N-acetyltransferase [Fusibacter ferrireducens]MBF4691939.1 GNAT family N-acetyltransferase [Fusibacter ferrireducens]
MIIETKHISSKSITWTLRSAKKSDADALAKLRRQIDCETEFLDRECGEGVLTATDFIQIIETDRLESGHLFLVAEHEDKLIGFTRCERKPLNRFNHQADFGICILKEYWGYGIGRHLISAVLTWADETNIEKVMLSVVEANESAIKLYQSVGFKREGLLLKDRKHADGRYHNTVLMGRMRSSG